MLIDSINSFVEKSKWKVSKDNKYRYFNINEEYQLRIYTVRFYKTSRTKSFVVELRKSIIEEGISFYNIIEHRSIGLDTLKQSKQYSAKIYFDKK